MNSYAMASKQWDKASLDQLPTEGVFRLRGLETTRLDTFVDAAFAFVLTLLVISFDEIPSNYQEIIETITKIPAFLVSFSVLMIFWLSHRGWSRRFGLENSATLMLSLAVIFTILVYVYPLRMVFESMFHWISDGYFASAVEIESFDQLRLMFNFYSAGFLVMSVLFGLIYQVSLMNKDALGLSDPEIWETEDAVRSWLVCAVVSVFSLLIANFATAQWVPASGWVYGLIYPAIILVNWLAKLRYSGKD